MEIIRVIFLPKFFPHYRNFSSILIGPTDPVWLSLDAICQKRSSLSSLVIRRQLLHHKLFSLLIFVCQIKSISTRSSSEACPRFAKFSLLLSELSFIYLLLSLLIPNRADISLRVGGQCVWSGRSRIGLCGKPFISRTHLHKSCDVLKAKQSKKITSQLHADDTFYFWVLPG